jgi:hypothetical protein
LEIVIGTTNPAKARQCRAALRDSGLRLRSLSELLANPPQVVEDGRDSEENAARKARAYSEIVGLPVLSLDYALTFDGLPPERQPGMNVRRIPGVEEPASDEQLVNYYSALFARHGGRIRGRWEAGAAVAAPEGRIERETIPVRRTFVSRPSVQRIDGYPLASLQLADGETYISELSDQEQEHLWQRILGKPLHDLVAAALSMS